MFNKYRKLVYITTGAVIKLKCNSPDDSVFDLLQKKYPGGLERHYYPYHTKMVVTEPTLWGKIMEKINEYTNGRS